MDYDDKLTVLVVSWDGAEELWHPFSEALNKFWSDCPLKKYLVTQTKKIDNTGFDKILCIPRKYTTERLHTAVTNIDTRYILLIADDFFFNENISTKKIIDHIQMMDELNLDYIKFGERENSFIFSFTVSLITKELLFDLTEHITCAYAREFEIAASCLMRQKSVKTKLSRYVFTTHCVLEGYWMWKPYLWCKKNNVPLTFKTYKKPSYLHSIYSFIKAGIFNIALFYLPCLYQIYAKKYKKNIN